MAETQAPPNAVNSWQSRVQLNPPPVPLKKPSRLGKILVENEEKIKNLMHEDQRRRRLSVCDTSTFTHLQAMLLGTRAGRHDKLNLFLSPAQGRPEGMHS